MLKGLYFIVRKQYFHLKNFSSTPIPMSKPSVNLFISPIIYFSRILCYVNLFDFDVKYKVRKFNEHSLKEFFKENFER